MCDCKSKSIVDPKESQDLEKDYKDVIAKFCIDKYSKLPKTGKPTQTEWTVLSCVVRYNPIDIGDIEVVSLGTGSKCIGATKMSASGDILNDSHAEVIARRGFLLYLYENIQKVFNGKSSIFTVHNGKCKLKGSIKFAFFSSQLPCGDAAIFPKADPDLIGDVLTSNSSLKRNADEELCEINSKAVKLDNNTADIHRTGAKCLDGAPQDSRKSGSSYHLLGQVRTKPGRGDRTLSVSCSDKIARWIHVGIQGALIDILLEAPIFISTFIYGNGVPYSHESLERALLGRNSKSDSDVTPDVPRLAQSSVCFPHVRSDIATKPAPGSILWVNTTTPILEVAVLGKKLGVTKKSMNSQSSQLSISKRSLYRHFIQLLNSNSNIKNSILSNEDSSQVSYDSMKKRSLRYYKNWSKVKEIFFGTWTNKGDIWNFTTDA